MLQRLNCSNKKKKTKKMQPNSLHGKHALSKFYFMGLKIGQANMSFDSGSGSSWVNSRSGENRVVLLRVSVWVGSDRVGFGFG